jgi:hypothetical protein
LDIYPPLFMNGNFMQEGRQHEYDWCPLLTSGVIVYGLIPLNAGHSR